MAKQNVGNPTTDIMKKMKEKHPKAAELKQSAINW